MHFNAYFVDGIAISRTSEFVEWFDVQNPKIQGLVRSRIELNSYFGDTNHLGDGLFELN